MADLPPMIQSGRLGQKTRRLVTLAKRMARNPDKMAECCYELLNTPQTTTDFLSGVSCLNNDGVPLQICLTSDRSGIAVRAIGDPGAFLSSTEERFSCSIETLLRVMESTNAGELIPTAKETVSFLIPKTPGERLAYEQGFVWIAASPDQPGIAFYLEMAPRGGDQGWLAIEKWFEQILPSSKVARKMLRTLRRYCIVASAGIEGSTIKDARAKIYFRLREPVGIGPLGVEIFSSPEMYDFLAIAMRSCEVDSEGLVMSIGISLSTGKLVDAKLDLCGHCLTHTSAEWSSVVREISSRFALAPLDTGPILDSGDYQMAFIGFGITTEKVSRLNLYIRNGSPSGPPDSDEIRCAATDAVRYLQLIQNQDGSWNDFCLPVGSSDQWITAYSALALARCSGTTGNKEALGAAVKGAAWLSSHRTYEAGWGFNDTTGPDTDSTAIAIALFDELGIPVAERDRVFLRDHWRDENGMATYDGPNAWGAGHWDVTPWGYLGMLTEDRDAYRERFLSAMARNRTESGFWRSYWWRNPFYSTFVTLEVLERLGLPEPAGPQNGSGDTIVIDNPFDLGCYVGIVSLRDRSDKRIGPHTRTLLNWQEQDGRWSGTENLRVTDDSCYTPWDNPAGLYYKDEKALLTTATNIRVLSGILAHRLSNSRAGSFN